MKYFVLALIKSVELYTELVVYFERYPVSSSGDQTLKVEFQPPPPPFADANVVTLGTDKPRRTVAATRIFHNLFIILLL
jgi:hypothetical protein